MIHLKEDPQMPILRAQKIQCVNVDEVVLMNLIKHEKESKEYNDKSYSGAQDDDYFELTMGDLQGNVTSEDIVNITNCYPIPYQAIQEKGGQDEKVYQERDDLIDQNFKSQQERIAQYNFDSNLVGLYQISYKSNNLQKEVCFFQEFIIGLKSNPAWIYLVYDKQLSKIGDRMPLKAYTVNPDYLQFIDGNDFKKSDIEKLVKSQKPLFQEIKVNINVNLHCEMFFKLYRNKFTEEVQKRQRPIDFFNLKAENLKLLDEAIRQKNEVNSGKYLDRQIDFEQFVQIKKYQERTQVVAERIQHLANFTEESNELLKQLSAF